MTTPNLFVIGAPKCGTTFLHSVLDQFRDVFMSPVKEPGFFSADNSFAKGIEHYVKTYFGGARGERWVGEATPWYLYSASALSRMATLVESPRFIVCVRDPAERAISMYADQVRAGYETRPLADALTLSSEAARVEQNYIETGLYAKFLIPWFDRFGQNQFLVLTAEDAKQESQLCVELADFLSVDPPALDRDRLRSNSRSDARLLWLSRWMRHASESEGSWKRAVRRSVPEQWIRLAGQRITSWNHNAAESTVHRDQQTLEALRHGYERSVIELEGLIGRDLSVWPSHPNHQAPRTHD
jgi:hypothetical protein